MKRLEPDKTAVLRDKLIKKRDGIYEEHTRAEEARRGLAEPEVEFEESAQNESIADALAVLDQQERDRIGAIDRALDKIRLGNYGACEVCGKPIPVKRLEAIPWTPFCTRHARIGTEPAKPPEPQPEARASLPPGFESLSGEELSDVIADEVREDGGVDLEELRIGVRGSKVYLEGFLPDKEQHQRLLDIVRDHMEIPYVVDRIIVSPAPWEREDRARGRRDFEEFPEEMQNEEDEAGAGPYVSRKSGSPMVPPDALVPEGE
jgi:DnaK suppressor protein